MQTPNSDSDVATLEDTLSQVAIASWNRVRSSSEIADFLNRRSSAVADIEL